MNCSQATPLLPWLLSGTLAAAEAAALRAHLRECPACGRELGATAEAWRLLDAHPPAAEVVAHALDAGPTSPELAAHLERCAACRAEVALVREEREGALAGAEEAPAPRATAGLPVPPRRAAPGGRWWATASLAAGLAAVVVAGQWWGGRGAPAPEADVELAELRPAGRVERGQQSAAARVTAPAVLLLLTDDVTPYDAYRLEIRRLQGDQGELLWSAPRVGPPKDGEVLLHLPAGALPAGELEVRLLGRRGEGWQLVERYALRLAER